MKKTVKSAVSLMLSAVLLFFALPAGASYKSDDYGHDKLYAFWQQEAYGGLNNGEAVYDHEWMQDVFYWSVGPENAHYDGSWNTLLVDAYSMFYDLSFRREIMYGFEEEIEEGVFISGEGIDILEPDLYGGLDLSETRIRILNSPAADQTHVTSVCLDGCELLEAAYFNGQRHAVRFSATGSGELKRLQVKDDPMKYIAFSPSAAEASFCIKAFGAGSVGADYNYSAEPNKASIFVYLESAPFKGWYKDGEIISLMTELSVAGGTYIAMFGGDVNKDCSVNASDALLALRAAMGLCEAELAEADINGSGSVDANDALAILRFALGIY